LLGRISEQGVPRWIKSLIGIALVIFIGLGYKIYSERAGLRIHEGLKKAEAEMKAKLPMKIDEITIWVKVKYEPTNTAYWLIVDDESIDAAELEKLIRNGVCTNADTLRTVREMNFTYEYHYADKELQPLASFTIRQCP
jgi:hypothetical protein